MNTLAKIILVAATVNGVAAFAEEMPDNRDANAGGSQFFYQTDGGHQAVTPGLKYSDQNTSFNFGKENISYLMLQIAYEYGINKMLSVGAMLGYTSGSMTQTGQTDVSISGFNNIDLYVRGTMAAGAGAFKYGADLSISPGDATSTTQSENAYTGGHQITPYLGYQLPMGPGVLGAKLSSQFDLGDRSVQFNGMTTKNSGGDTTELDVFYEQPVSTMLWGGAVSYESIGASKANGVSSNNYSPWIDLQVYGVIYAGPGEFLPTLHYAWTSDTNENGQAIKGLSRWSAGAGYRMTF